MEVKITETIKKENRKALPKYLLIMLACLLTGVVLGALIAIASRMGMKEKIVPGLQTQMGILPAYMLPALCALLLIASIVVMRKVRAMWKNWDGEDDSLPEAVERRLEQLLLVQNITAPLAFLAFTLDGAYDKDLLRSSFTLLFFLVYLILLVWRQKQVVDFVRMMNPEKRGSLYDMNFQKKWISSCDEAEKKQMGEAALATYHSMTWIYSVTWLLMLFLSKIFGFGVMPAVTAIALWGISSTIYNVKEMQIRRHQ